ncbi:uncharacterized protein PV09_01465 [Verruconis gallopava]|uniref:DUF1014 domain-containing protein n=1 Tax=Verruconis gallopava TaxID=253628 RepID=A0A0D2AM36_9PEZI|nr:uncharacterized protein PV09_01465 [Verruconis gallopava]KIW07500.1 hypothetical protein PV09_01465 [Verruconis gallopava]
MGGKKSGGENSKKAAGQARKAEAAAAKQAAKDREIAAREDAEWAKGAKDNSKKEAAAAKAAEAARKKAEKEALLREEEASLPTKAKSGNARKAEKKTRGTLDLGQLDDAPTGKAKTINASGIDNALDALSLTGNPNNDVANIDRHPERRFKAAYTAYETRRLEEMKDEKGLRRQQKIEQIRKEFDKHPDNPFNQVSARYDSTKEELREIAANERRKVEERLASAP